MIKSFSTPNYNDLIELTKKDKCIVEDANGAEFIILLSKMLNWINCIREVKNDTDMKKADNEKPTCKYVIISNFKCS